MIKQLALILCLFGFIFIMATCDQNDPNEAPPAIEFLVIDHITGLPLKDAEIQLLEDGPSVVTNAEGNAGFSESDLVGAPVTAITDSIAYAFSIRHPDFQVREVNVSSATFTVRLMPDSTGIYEYTKPVQLDDGLKVGTLIDAGFDTARMHRLMKRIAKPGYRDLHSILIYKEGQLVLEEYYFGNNDTIQFENGVIRDRSPEPIWWSRKEKHYVASVNKALTSTVVGIALESKGLPTDALLKDYLPQYASYFENDANKSAVNFYHALNMTLGFQWDEWASTDLVKMWKEQDFGAFLLSRPNKGPNSEWYYNSASPNLMLKAVENMVNEPIRSWAHTNFYERLGITDYEWQRQPDGYPEGSARMFIRPRDMLKVGITYLNKGKWNGEQVIPESWVERCMEAQKFTSSGRYSHLFWIRELQGLTYLSADGDGGNYINIFPEENMVIVFTQGNYLQWPLYVNQANDIMGNYIIPAIK